MITTLLKHEWLRTRNPMLGIAVIAALAVGAATLLALTGWPVIAGFGAGIGIVITLALTPVTQIVLAFDFWNSSFRRTGYFTQSLPIRGSTIYWTKALWGAIVSLASLALTVLLLALFWLGFGPLIGVDANVFAHLGPLFEVMPTALTVSLLAFLIVAYLGFLAQLLFAATLGSGAKLNRLGIGGPIIVYIAVYIAGQVLVLVCMVAIPLGIDLSAGGFELIAYNVFADLGASVTSSADPASTPSEIMPIGFVPPLLVIFVVAAVWAARRWDTRIALA